MASTGAGPDYVERNHLGHTRALPGLYWTGETDMHYMAQALGQTLATAHTHHIQRLMVTGNFALLIGADPKQVHLWYLEIYLDTYEWVELPNTRGMSQSAEDQAATRAQAAAFLAALDANGDAGD